MRGSVPAIFLRRSLEHANPLDGLLLEAVALDESFPPTGVDDLDVALDRSGRTSSIWSALMRTQ